jgi:hypothetical protein
MLAIMIRSLTTVRGDMFTQRSTHFFNETQPFSVNTFYSYSGIVRPAFGVSLSSRR